MYGAAPTGWCAGGRTAFFGGVPTGARGSRASAGFIVAVGLVGLGEAGEELNFEDILESQELRRLRFGLVGVPPFRASFSEDLLLVNPGREGTVFGAEVARFGTTFVLASLIVDVLLTSRFLVSMFGRVPLAALEDARVRGESLL